jgi:DNA mismatch repair protein MutL
VVVPNIPQASEAYKSKYFGDRDRDHDSNHDLSGDRPGAADSIRHITGLKPGYKILGEAFYGYIFIEKDEKIIVIDKHAAHERIIYDRLIKKAGYADKNPEFETQIMLVPVKIKLTPKEAAAIAESETEESIKKLGIIFEWEDDETIIITEIPIELSGGSVNIGEIIKEAADHAPGSEAKPVFEKIAMLAAKKSRACRAAMKSSVSDHIENIAWLADRVINRGDIKYCPHGRPVAFEITKSDIEKRFGR